jgi:hypothetical protein
LSDRDGRPMAGKEIRHPFEAPSKPLGNPFEASRGLRASSTLSPSEAEAH